MFKINYISWHCIEIEHYRCEYQVRFFNTNNVEYLTKYKSIDPIKGIKFYV